MVEPFADNAPRALVEAHAPEVREISPAIRENPSRVREIAPEGREIAPEGREVADEVPEILPEVREISPAPDPWDAFLRLAHLPRALFLDGAVGPEGKGRFSYVTASPFELVETRGATTWVSRPATADLAERRLRRVLSTGEDPFEVLGRRLRAHAARRIPDLPPFQGGAAGLFGFGLGRRLERIPPPRSDEFQAPDLACGLNDWVLAFDHDRGTCHLLSREPRGRGDAADGVGWREPSGRPARAKARAEEVCRLLERRLDRSSGPPHPFEECREDALSLAELGSSRPVLHTDGPVLEGLLSDRSREEYLHAVERIIEYIRAGDVFQVNLSHRLLFPLRRAPLEIYEALRRRNPAPFGGFASWGRHVVLSASPEHFLALEGKRVVTRPIKGTRPRGKSPEEDDGLRRSLLESPKDRSENVMIVDLLRNDLSRVARPWSVRAPRLFDVETHPTVHHLVSEVTAELQDDASAVDLLRATFPGGSVTGAPKVRAQEIIAELEPHARGFYCGSLGWIGFDGDLGLNLLIRTMTLSRGWIQLPVGGGVVASSDPEAEYEETMDKAEGPLLALRG